MKPTYWVAAAILGAILSISGLVVLDACLRSNLVEVVVRNSSGALVHEVRVTEYGKPLLEIEQLTPGMVRRCSYNAETDGGVDLYYRGADGAVVRVEGPYTTGGSNGTVEFTFQPEGVELDSSQLSLSGWD